MTQAGTEKIGNPKAKFKNKKAIEDFIFVTAMWFLSRLLIIIAMQFIAPSLSFPPKQYEYPPLAFTPNFVPQMGWELFSHWDGKWYHRIATLGYEYANDGEQYSVAFFPLFPLLTRGVMTLGLPFEIAGTIVNNLALLGAMFVLYLWTKEQHSITTARWTTAVLAWCPFSLYGTVIYTEGLFLLITTAALRAFDNRKYAWAGLWGAMATATRPTGITLLPTFLFVSWKEKRPVKAYAASLVTAIGLILYILYCATRFGEPLAFAHVQKAWIQPTWKDILIEIFFYDHIRGLIKIVMFFGSSYLLWHYRHQLSRVAIVYGFCSLGMVIASGALASLSRYIYGIASIPLAFGILLSHHPRWGYRIIGLFAAMLGGFAIRFAWWEWVA